LVIIKPLEYTKADILIFPHDQCSAPHNTQPENIEKVIMFKEDGEGKEAGHHHAGMTPLPQQTGP
jgi:hypothetical protein